LTQAAAVNPVFLLGGTIPPKCDGIEASIAFLHVGKALNHKHKQAMEASFAINFLPRNLPMSKSLWQNHNNQGSLKIAWLCNVDWQEHAISLHCAWMEYHGHKIIFYCWDGNNIPKYDWTFSLTPA
jgi:hypothetical protein